MPTFHFQTYEVQTTQPCLDNRHKIDFEDPEIREYYAVYIFNDMVVGERSNNVSIAVP